MNKQIQQIGKGVGSFRLMIYPPNQNVSKENKQKIINNKMFITIHITGKVPKLKKLIGDLVLDKTTSAINRTKEFYWYDMPIFESDDKMNFPVVYLGFTSIQHRNEFTSKLGIDTLTDGKRYIHYPNKIITKNKKQKYVITRKINPKYPVYIISKGRWKSRMTVKTLEEIGCPYKIVVEKQEYEKYADVIDKSKILILPQKFIDVETRKFKIRSSIPARNFVWWHAVQSGAKKHWILDDNMRHFYRWNFSYKWVIDSGVLLKLIEDYVDRFDNILQAGMNYAMFVPSRSDPYPITFNTRIYSCILNDHRIDKLVDTIRWKNMNYNEDTDLSLRILKKGYSTCLFNAFLCGKAANLSVKGGNSQTQYTIGNNLNKPNTANIKAKSQALADEHPDVATVVKRFKRGWHHQVNYKPFKDNKLGYKNPKIKKTSNEYNMKLVNI
jgi:hypothetical protein